MATARRKVDWLKFEARIREELKEIKNGADADKLAVSLQRISDIVGEETGRGYVLDWPSL